MNIGEAVVVDICRKSVSRFETEAQPTTLTTDPARSETSLNAFHVTDLRLRDAR